MDLLNWLTEPHSQPEDLPSPSPPDFLSIHKTKPAKLRGGGTGRNTRPLTPLESQIKDIVLNLYSDKGTVASTARGRKEAQTFVGDVDLHRRSPTSPRGTPEGSSFPDSERTSHSSLPVRLQRSQSSSAPLPTSPEPYFHHDVKHKQQYFSQESLIALSDDGEESLSWPKSKPETSIKTMSDLTPPPCKSELSSGFIFSADDTAWDQTDPEAPPIRPVVGSQYPSSSADQLRAREQIPPSSSHEGGELNQPLAFRQHESQQFSMQPDAYIYMYSHSDSSFSMPYPPKPPSLTSEPRSGVIESFGIEPQEFQPPNSSQRASREPQLYPSSGVGDSEPPRCSDRESIDGGDHSIEGASRDRSETPVAETHTPPTSELTPSFPNEHHSTPSYTDEHHSTPSYTDGLLPQSSNYQDTKAPQPHNTAEPKKPSSVVANNNWQLDIPLEAPNTQSSGSGDSPLLSTTGSSTPLSTSVGPHLQTPLSTSVGPHLPPPPSPPPQPHDASVYALTGLDDIETNSVVSIQQLTESLQNEPPDTHSLLDDIQTLESGSSMVPFAPNIRQKEKDTPMAKPYTPSTPKRPLPFEMPLESPVVAKMPHHLQASPKPPRKAKRTPTETSPTTNPFPPQISSTPAAAVTKPILGLPPRRVTSTTTSSVGTSDIPGETDNRVKALEHELTQALQAKANLEGQLESVVSECKETLKGRAELQMKLAKAETELSEIADALSRERAREKQRPLATGMEEPALRKELEGVKDELRAARDRERKTAERHKQETDRASKLLKNDLAEGQEVLKAKDATITDLQDKIKSMQTDLEQKAAENQEAACKLSSLEASYDALEGTKAWLHDQLQEALESKMKLQEGLRESKTSAIARGIKAEQLQRENEALQRKVTDLQKGVLQDKARLVSELEAIEADVLSREDSYAQLVAEKAQLEDLAKMRGRDIEQLNNNLAQAQVQNEALEQQLGEIYPEKDALVRETQNLKRENKDFEEMLRSTQQELDIKEADLAELEKLKSTLQERLRQSDASLLNKEGTMQGLNDAKEILKHELEMVKQARDGIETELSDAKREVAELEGDLKAALDKNREKDAILKGLSNTQQNIAGEKHSLETQLANREKELAQKSDQLKAFQAQSSVLVDEFKSLQGQFHSIAAESGVVQDNVAEKDRVITHLSAEKEKMEEELADLKKRDEHVRDKLAQLQHEKARLEGTVEASSATNLEEFQRAMQDKAQLQADLNSLKVSQQREAIKAQAKTNRLETDLKTANREATKAQKELDKLRREKDEDVQRLRDDISHLEDEVRNVRSKLDKALRDKERLESTVEALKPSEGQVESLSAECERLSRQNQELAEQLQHEATQRAEIERASGMVAMKLKQNAEEREHGLDKQLKDSSLELERLRGRLAGMNITQQAMRDHSGSLEATLAKKESSLIRLSAQVQKVLEEKELEDQTFADKIASLEMDLGKAKKEVKSQRDREQFLSKKVGELERELTRKEAAMENLKDSLIQKEVPLLEKKVGKLAKDKDGLQNEISSLKSQLVMAKISVSGVKRELADKNSQIDILTRELDLAKARGRQAEGEIKQLQDSLKSLEQRHASEIGHLQQSLSEASRERDSCAMDDDGEARRRKGLFDASLSTIALDEETDRPQHLDTSEGSIGSLEHKPDTDEVGHMNDTLRASSQQTINQLMGYNSLYRAHLKEMGSRLETARRQGQEAAEVKKSGEISVLRSELGNKSRTIGNLQSCLHSLKEDMTKLHQQMDLHSATIHASHDSSRQIESRLEDLKRNSTLP